MDLNHYILVDRVPVIERDLTKWSTWMCTNDRIVRQDQVTDEVFVSTVFLGFNHNVLGNVALLFETMIFGGKHDQYMDRYSTWEQAEKGHEAALKLVQRPKFTVITGGKIA